MLINLSPVRCDDALQISVDQDVITINGVSFDFSPLKEGDTLPANAVESVWFIEDVRRVLGEVTVTVRFPHGPYADQAARFPEPIAVKSSGVVTLPDPGHVEKTND